MLFIRKIRLSNFKTDNSLTMEEIFDYCTSLKEINLSNFNTNKIIRIDSLFRDCKSLEEINISNFNTDNLKVMFMMFMVVNL